MNENPIQIATHSLLTPFSLNTSDLEKAIGCVMGPSVDSADIFLQSVQEENWMLEESIIKNGAFSVDQGFGLRVVSGERIGFSYANDINEKTLLRAVHSAKGIAHSTRGFTLFFGDTPNKTSSKPIYSSLNPINSMTTVEKIKLLQGIDEYTRSRNSHVKDVVVNLTGRYETMLVLNNEGLIAADVRPLVHLQVRVILEHNGFREQGFGGGGARCGYEMFLSTAYLYADKAIQQAYQNLRAEDAPAGIFPVVLGPGWPAILLHEAVGHGLEGDFNRKGTSAFSGQMNQRVASSLCTIVDDGTIPGKRGSLGIDDEGTVTQKTVLIEKGILKNYMQDRHNARLMKMKPTGNGRRESYAHLPLPRMTNTYLLPGKSDVRDIISSVEKGLYAVDFSGGQVDITSGKFVFSTSEAYLINRGKITRPVKRVTLIGNGLDVLTKVSMVGNDMSLDSGIGICGKSGQSVPVGVGQPTIKVDALTIGGSNLE
ncbi:metalloprotease TldD [Coxiella endosymbiont of Amblyomma sculptum]|uniref:metalloprotease TldD n=1 Tax=Coxiella endosymbiont of Amblyomma sculptum TaxID=2487929 RepID=UPI00132EFB9E|nr:metalloprotease TldD [Coxiella endosymbiont of Amblyomma sculptum]QHG92676.1 metalloprotease TldD [Coxiella endosymbiont of Amblyomma sculptum]